MVYGNTGPYTTLSKKCFLAPVLVIPESDFPVSEQKYETDMLLVVEDLRDRSHLDWYHKLKVFDKCLVV